MPSLAKWKFAPLIFALTLVLAGWFAFSRWESVAKPWKGSEPFQGYIGKTEVQQLPMTKLRLAKVRFAPKDNTIIVHAHPIPSSPHHLIAINQASTLTVTGRSRDTRWLYVQLPDQTTGWVDASSGQLIGTLSAVPEVPVSRKEISK